MNRNKFYDNYNSIINCQNNKIFLAKLLQIEKFLCDFKKFNLIKSFYSIKKDNKF